jgi:hypothetical protein
MGKKLVSRSSIAAAAAIMLLGLAVWVGCGKGGGAKSIYEDPKYAGWKSITQQNIKIYYPPDHVFESKFPEIADHYLFAIKRISATLSFDPPKDTIVIFYYTGFGQGREMTGQQYPFVKDGIIHFWLPSFLGPTLVDRILPYWEKRDPAYPFLRHGLRSLFDFSGQNYHQTTTEYARDSVLIPLAKLAADTLISSDTERVQSGEAASFIAYVLAYYGAARLKTMYESEVPFDQMVEQLFYISVDSLQSSWLDFAKQNVPPDTTAQPAGN